LKDSTKTFEDVEMHSEFSLECDWGGHGLVLEPNLLQKVLMYDIGVVDVSFETFCEHAFEVLPWCS
jgi:hypothetical protein